jgi:hypothetical protein
MSSDDEPKEAMKTSIEDRIGRSSLGKSNAGVFINDPLRDLWNRKQSIDLGRIGHISALTPILVSPPSSAWGLDLANIQEVQKAFMTAQQMLEYIHEKTYERPWYLKIFDVVGGCDLVYYVCDKIYDFTTRLEIFVDHLKRIREYKIVIIKKRDISTDDMDYDDYEE